MSKRLLSPEVRSPPADGDGAVILDERPRRGRHVAAAFAMALVAIGAVAFAVARDDDGGGGAREAYAGETTTALVARRDLVQRDTVSGALGFADERRVVNYVAGTITYLPPEGGVIGRGQTLYAVDERPVVLFFGAQPAWRPLRVGVANGQDVHQLERNLRALGYDPGKAMAVDRRFDAATAAAVVRWQADIGTERTGAVERGAVVFFPGARRGGTLLAAVGDAAPPGRPLIATSSTARVVSAAIDAAKQNNLRIGAEVIVELLNGTTTTGRIRGVDAVATRVEGEREDDETSVIGFEVVLDKPRLAGKLDEAPVEVQVTDEKATAALSVPVSALLARRGGGYAVEVARGGTPTLVAVEPGLYSDGGFVEITGAVTRGERVVVPR